jgi:hypothetical protein
VGSEVSPEAVVANERVKVAVERAYDNLRRRHRRSPVAVVFALLDDADLREMFLQASRDETRDDALLTAVVTFTAGFLEGLLLERSPTTAALAFAALLDRVKAGGDGGFALTLYSYLHKQRGGKVWLG